MPECALRCLGKCARWFPQVVPGAAAEIAYRKMLRPPRLSSWSASSGPGGTLSALCSTRWLGLPYSLRPEPWLYGPGSVNVRCPAEPAHRASSAPSAPARRQRLCRLPVPAQYAAAGHPSPVREHAPVVPGCGYRGLRLAFQKGHLAAKTWWAQLGSNQRPLACKTK